MEVTLLRGVVQPYDWGDAEAIPAILGQEPDGSPQAEFWLGAHERGPSLLPDRTTLAEAIAADPVGSLGEAVANRFGELPFLFKVLAAASPLSIQAHPSKEQAEVGFARENKLGVPVAAPRRVYRDDNHKPELICALDRFEGLCGFRSASATADVLRAAEVVGLEQFAAQLVAGGDSALPTVVEGLLSLGVGDAAKLVASIANVRTVEGKYAREWQWARSLAGQYPNDPGVAVSLLLNYFELAPGEAIFLPAGNLHAYLKGVGVELMANSDNVVRGGLTSKHVDIPELLETVDFTPIEVSVVSAGFGSGSTVYEVPVEEFGLVRYSSGEPEVVTPSGPEIVLITEGEGMIKFAGLRDKVLGRSIVLQQGQSAFIPGSSCRYTLKVNGVGWRATVGLIESRSNK